MLILLKPKKSNKWESPNAIVKDQWDFYVQDCSTPDNSSSVCADMIAVADDYTHFRIQKPLNS